MGSEDDSPPKKRSRKPRRSKKSSEKRKATTSQRKVRKSTSSSVRSSDPNKRRRRKVRRRRRSESLARRIARLFAAVALGALAGIFVCGYATYASARYDVEQWLQPTSVAQNANVGKAWSAPVRLWRGADIHREAIVDILQAAGYTKVDQLEKSLDFTVTEREVVVDNHDNSLGENEGFFRIQFARGRINAIRKSGGREVAEITLQPMLLATFQRANSLPKSALSIAEIPEHIPQAVLAMEDSRFYQHEGVDFIGLARAIFINLIKDSKSQGASTITQQLVKNLILNNSEKTYKRKAREALRALALEERLEKAELLELYLNEVYLGQVNGMAVVGVEQAAKIYFGKDAARLTVGEAAMISGIISAPNTYSPLRHPERAKKRRDITLKRLRTLDWISEDVYATEFEKDLALNITPMRRRANWYVDTLMDLAEKQQGQGVVAANALQIVSTLDPVLQHILEKSVSKSLIELEKNHPKAKGAQIAAIAISPTTGEVKALVGGRSYARSQFNRALYARRQIGSIAKPFLFALLFDSDANLSPGCWVEDKPIALTLNEQVWSPANYDRTFQGQMTLRDALRVSRNIPTVNVYQWMERTTENTEFFLDFGRKVGLYDISAVPADALGAFTASPLEVAGAYSIFANAGRYIEPRFLRQITAQDGSLVYAPIKQTPKQVLSEESAWMVQSMLTSVVSEGTAKSAKQYGASGALAGKTGTTNEANDAWFVGYDADTILAIWVGFDKGRALGLTGGQAALPTWARFMAKSTPYRSSEFEQLGSVKMGELCKDWEACSQLSNDWFRNTAQVESRCAIFEHEYSEEALLERIIPEGVQDKIDLFKPEQEEEGFLHRILPWKRNK